MLYRNRPVTVQAEKISDLLGRDYNSLPGWIKERYPEGQIIFTEKFIVFGKVVATADYYIVKHPAGWTQIITSESFKKEYYV